MAKLEKSFLCLACGAGLVVPVRLAGTRVRCGDCLSSVYVPRGLGTKSRTLGRSSKAALGVGRSFFQSKLQIPRIENSEALRYCTLCGIHRFIQSGYCACRGLTLGLDPLKVAIGRETEEQDALRGFDSLKLKVFRADIAVALLLVAVTAYYFLFKNILVALVILPFIYLFLGSLWVGMRYLSVYLFSEKVEPYLPGRWKGRPTERAKLLRLIREYAEPFLERVSVGTRSKAEVPQSELDLFGRLFQKNDFDLDPQYRNQFIQACVLIRDYDAFKCRLENLSVMNEQSVIDVYATLNPLGANDVFDLPFLRQIELDQGREASSGVVLAKLKKAREDLKLEAFEKDLQRVKDDQGGFNISIEQIDLMDPFNFELLIGMFYECLGFQVEETPRSGDQGADVIAIKAGERMVIQTKLYSKPVNNSAVQEVVAAKQHWKCAKTAVVTNNQFTKSALELAESNKVEMIAREQLITMIAEFNPQPKNYGKLLLLMKPKAEAIDTVEATVTEDVKPSAS
ncbi:MAG: restriction endonuclease [Planctomycetota bacterium]|nr:restriction endonuclease [Planctomycetota bacterium]